MAVWENESADIDGAGITFGGNAGVLFGSATVERRTGHGMLLGGSVSNNTTHSHVESPAAHKCAPPVLTRRPLGFVALICWICGIAALLAFWALLVQLYKLGFVIGSDHFKHFRGSNGDTIRHVAKYISIFIVTTWIGVTLGNFIARLRRRERAAFDGAMELWQSTYYCERDGWIGVPA